MPKKKLITNMASKQESKLSWNEKIKKVEGWLSKRGYRVISGNERHIVDSVDFDLKLVLLSTKSKPENQFYSILHECGHILNREKSYSRKYKFLKQSETDVRKQQTVRYLVEEIEEETEAWRRGAELAARLKIAPNDDVYQSYASKYLMTYIVEAARLKNKKETK